MKRSQNEKVSLCWKESERADLNVLRKYFKRRDEEYGSASRQPWTQAIDEELNDLKI